MNRLCDTFIFLLISLSTIAPFSTFGEEPDKNLKAELPKRLNSNSDDQTLRELQDGLKSQKDLIKELFYDDFVRPELSPKPETTRLFPKEFNGLFIGMPESELLKNRKEAKKGDLDLTPLVRAVFPFVTGYYEERLTTGDWSLILYLIYKQRLAAATLVCSSFSSPETRTVLVDRIVDGIAAQIDMPTIAGRESRANGLIEGAVIEWRSSRIFVRVHSINHYKNVFFVRWSIGDVSALAETTDFIEFLSLPIEQGIAQMQEFFPSLSKTLSTDQWTAMLAEGKIVYAPYLKRTDHARPGQAPDDNPVLKVNPAGIDPKNGTR